MQIKFNEQTGELTISKMEQLKLEENIQASELIAKWNKNPSSYGVYDIIGGLEYIGTKEALDLRDYIIDKEEYDVKDILQLVNNLKLK